MTREVAIKAIQDFIGWFKEDSLIRKALEMAISALDNRTPCSLCRFRNEDTGICDMCPAMPNERGAE